MRPGYAVSGLALLGLLGAGALTFAFLPSPAPAATFGATAALRAAALHAAALHAAALRAAALRAAALRTGMAEHSAASAAVRPAAGPLASDAPLFSRLPALRVENQTTRDVLETRLYDATGAIDEAAADKLDALLCDARDPRHHHVTRLNRRTLQLVFRAAYHFGAPEVEVVSAYRKPGRHREGLHGHGSAIDFRLRGVAAAELARYLRNSPRTGVGVYTHPKTQYVHLDAREQSYHWLDASPPRRRWREKPIGKSNLSLYDASYTTAMDLPSADGKQAP